MSPDLTPPSKAKALAIINQFLHDKTKDSWACLHPILLQWAEQDELLASNLAQPLVALRHTIEGILARKESLYEFVRQIDVRYAETHHERPIFQKPGEAPHPDDEYTHESVEVSLKAILQAM